VISSPLSDIKVLDFTHAAAGPFASMFLADLGADVVKVERPPYGDGARSMGAPLEGFSRNDSDYYLSLNRNKKGIVLDLTNSAARDVALRLAERCDVVIQNFRPGVMERLGLDFENLRRRRPSLVYCSISAFGGNGPWSHRPANDIIMQSVSGLMAVTGEVGGGPVRIGAPVADFGTGLFALSAILAALHARADHPEGQHVTVSMLEASLNLMCNYIPSVAGAGVRIPRVGRAHAQIVPYQAFACSDGEYVMVGAFNRTFWQNLCRALGKPGWLADEQYSTNAARLRNRDELIAELEAIFAEHDRAYWLRLLEEADIPNSPVFELDEAVRSEQAEFDHSIYEVREGDSAVSLVRSPMRSEQWVGGADAMAPSLGRDTREVLIEMLGMTPAEVDDLLSRFDDTAAATTTARATTS
jgi:crotonobetainyl-CoA:carnitine CoA-transferase CaiB-like acyl-CoA transferase